jgi:hypothetical protein
MCAIVCSFNKDKLKELYKLNSYRGELSFSLATINLGMPLFNTLQQGEGKMPDNLVDELPLHEYTYMVTHSQAPTTNTSNIHPARYGDSLLWHNGIVKQKNIIEGTWDTAWLLEQIVHHGWDALSEVDGTFACILYHEDDLYVFRNEISPLYIDSNLNISSTKFEHSNMLQPNIVFKFGYKDHLIMTAGFKTKENPYYIPELT